MKNDIIEIVNKLMDENLYAISAIAAKPADVNGKLTLLSNLDNKLNNLFDEKSASLNNKLTPIKNLCAMLKNGDLVYDLDPIKHKLIEREIEKVLLVVEELKKMFL